MSKSLKKFLKKHADGDSLGVADAKLGAVIKEKLGIACVASGAVSELSRGIRAQLGGLVSGLAEGGGEGDKGSNDALAPMALGLAHSLSRYKLKFSPDKVDTMVVQAIGLLDDLDKELNTYAMRAREWCVSFFLERKRSGEKKILLAPSFERAIANEEVDSSSSPSGEEAKHFLLRARS